MKQFLVSALVGFGFVCFVQADHPNILVILADDLGYADLGFQGSEEIETPNLDRLRVSGTLFTDAHVTASVCSPSRAGMMTGRYQQQFGHEPNCPPQEFGMNLQEKTIADALKPLGYHTGLIGKWHLGDQDQFYPTRRGFDYFCGLREGSRSYFFDVNKDDKPGSFKAIEINGEPVKFEGYLTDYFSEKAVEFVDGQSAEQPFFLFLSYTAPHAPMHATEEDKQRFAHIENEKRRTYAAMVWAMDRGVGQVLDALDEKGFRENTLVFFLSDNGGPINHNASVNLPLNGEKGIKFEGGIRVPFVMSWPGQLPKGGTYDAMVSSLDILPTVLTVAGGEPDYEHLAGQNLLPFVLGQMDSRPHQKLYWHKEWFSAMRDGDWKLIYIQDFGYALYNLKDDLGEKNNVAKLHPERLEQMSKELNAWKAKGTGSEWTEGPKWYKFNRQLHIDLIAEGSEVPLQ
ncbi:sulfatase-like hydrolase/transferase [Pontiellaceae bacterium B1224]|nr:sulfatase-like hydrolase/transferase [Pontiellaceae bacterium B1224]